MINIWFQIALQRNIVLRAFKLALIVGSILMLINHGDVMLNNELSQKGFIKIIVTYFVPYCVSTYSSTEAICAIENKPSINKLMASFFIQKVYKLKDYVETILHSR